MTEKNDNRELWLDMAMLVMPWLFLAWMVLWGVAFGPNQRPAWPIGSLHTYNAFIAFHICAFGVGIPVFALPRLLIHRRRRWLMAAVITSGLIVGWFGGPSLMFG